MRFWGKIAKICALKVVNFFVLLFGFGGAGVCSGHVYSTNLMLRGIFRPIHLKCCQCSHPIQEEAYSLSLSLFHSIPQSWQTNFPRFFFDLDGDDMDNCTTLLTRLLRLKITGGIEKLSHSFDKLLKKLISISSFKILHFAEETMVCRFSSF